MKICSPDITHKSDAGGVMLNLDTPEKVRGAFQKIHENCRCFNPQAQIKGVTLQKMLPRHDYELIIGAHRDREFGPVLLFGNGGIFTEILQDKALALPPVNRLLARRMMEETKIFKVLKGYRSRPGVDLVVLEEILIRLSQLVCDFAEIAAIDINPLFISGSRALAMDARVMVAASDKPAPHHLVISPYPNHYEQRLAREDVGELLIRPVRPEDAPLVVELFGALSSQSIYYRFFQPKRVFKREMLQKQWATVDYRKNMSIVGLAQRGKHKEIVAIGSYYGEGESEHAEVAFLVREDYQGMGIGSYLLDILERIARVNKYKAFTATVMSENAAMLHVFRKQYPNAEISPYGREIEVVMPF